MAAQKRRVDQVLVERGFAETRQKAQALLMAGQVLVREQKVEKPGTRIEPGASIRILGELPFVSRAGAKLQAAIGHFGISIHGRICADLGASTGGFTDCLLQYGAAEVHAFDVGTGQLAWKLQSDPRVVRHDGFNVRYLKPGDLPANLSVVTADLSFISLTKVLEPLRGALRICTGPSPVHVVLLVKPQFELRRGEVGKGGIVRDPAKRRAAVKAVGDFASRVGYGLVGTIPSPVEGAEGNREFLMYLQLPLEL